MPSKKETNGHVEDQLALLDFLMCEELRVGMRLTL